MVQRLCAVPWCIEAYDLDEPKEDVKPPAVKALAILDPSAALAADALRAGGFRQVDCFWRWMNFAGWVAVRD